ncbi:TPA: DUF4189 domain-containing protein [Neisseria oralis]|jgi:hypothetical protein
MKKVFLLFITLSLNGFINANPLGGDPTQGYCQTVDGSACGWEGGSSSSRQAYKVPNRWGAIYFNPANGAIGYSENNTGGYRSANREALESCIRNGGGNPIAKDDKGCRMLTEIRNSCTAIALGGTVGNGGYGAKNDSNLKLAEQKALAACGKHSDSCTIRYSGCSRHPDYRY